MWIRSALGAMDMNINAGRKQATTEQGALRWRIKVKLDPFKHKPIKFRDGFTKKIENLDRFHLYRN